MSLFKKLSPVLAAFTLTSAACVQQNAQTAETTSVVKDSIVDASPSVAPQPTGENSILEMHNSVVVPQMMHVVVQNADGQKDTLLVDLKNKGRNTTLSSWKQTPCSVAENGDETTIRMTIDGKEFTGVGKKTLQDMPFPQNGETMVSVHPFKNFLLNATHMRRPHPVSARHTIPRGPARDTMNNQTLAFKAL